MADNQPPHQYNVTDQEMQMIVGDAINFQEWFEVCKRHRIFTPEGEQAGQQIVDLYDELIEKCFRLFTRDGRQEIEGILFRIHYESFRFHLG